MKKRVLAYNPRDQYRPKHRPEKDPQTPEDLRKLLEELLDADNATKYRTETPIINFAAQWLTDPKTTPEFRLEIASLLEQLGVFVHGNLNPQGKEFKPDKIQLFRFEKPLRELRFELSRTIARVAEGGKVKDFEKRGKVIANLTFNVTLLVDGIKHRRTLTVPICIPKTSVAAQKKEEANGHAEAALLQGLQDPKQIKRILEELIQTARHADIMVEEDTALYKINAAVLQVASTLQSCDACHEDMSTKLINGPIKTQIEIQAKKLGIAIPQKTSKGIATAIQYAYALSPDPKKSANKYTKPTFFDEKKSPRQNFTTAGLVVQRQSKKSKTVDRNTPYTLFISNGPDKATYTDWFPNDEFLDTLWAIWGKKIFETRSKFNNYIQKVRPRVMAASVEKEDFKTALEEWRFYGDKDEVDKEGGERQDCEFCGHVKLSYYFVIENTLIDKSLKIGSECIQRFEEVDLIDDEGMVLKSREARKEFLKIELDILKARKSPNEIQSKLKEIDEVDLEKNGFLEIFIASKRNILDPKTAAKIFKLKADHFPEMKLKLHINQRDGAKFVQLSREELELIRPSINKGDQKVVYGLIKKKKKAAADLKRQKAEQERKRPYLELLNNLERRIGRNWEWNESVRRSLKISYKQAKVAAKHVKEDEIDLFKTFYAHLISREKGIIQESLNKKAPKRKAPSPLPSPQTPKRRPNDRPPPSPTRIAVQKLIPLRVAIKELNSKCEANPKNAFKSFDPQAHMDRAKACQEIKRDLPPGLKKLLKDEIEKFEKNISNSVPNKKEYFELLKELQSIVS